MVTNIVPTSSGNWQQLKIRSRIALWGLGFYAFILFNDLWNWPILKFARVVSPMKYRDTSWVLADADCYERLGLGIYGLESETGCPGYLYGSSLLRLLTFLNIHEYHTVFFAQVMRAFFAIAVAYTVVKISNSTRQAISIFILISFSPGVQLMLYNANFDLLIFAMVIASHFAFRKNLIVLSLILISLSGAFKFYTIPLLLVMTILAPKIRQKFIAILCFLLVSGLAVSDLKLMQEEIPSTGYAQFGFTIFTRYISEIGIDVSTIVGYLLSTIILLGTLFTTLFFKKKITLGDCDSDPDRLLLFLMLGIVFVSCFFTGLSYDPRLIYLSLAATIISLHSPSSVFRRISVVLVLVSSFLSCGLELGFMPKGETGLHPARFIQLLNDVAIEFLTVFILLYLIDLWASAKGTRRLGLIFRNEISKQNG